MGPLIIPRTFGKLLLGFIDTYQGQNFFMVVVAALCWSMWVTRNKVTFEDYVVRSPFEVIFTMCSFLLYWSGLQGGDNRDKLAEGPKKLMKLAADLAREAQRQEPQIHEMIDD